MADTKIVIAPLEAQEKFRSLAVEAARDIAALEKFLAPSYANQVVSTNPKNPLLNLPEIRTIYENDIASAPVKVALANPESSGDGLSTKKAVLQEKAKSLEGYKEMVIFYRSVVQQVQSAAELRSQGAMWSNDPTETNAIIAVQENLREIAPEQATAGMFRDRMLGTESSVDFEKGCKAVGLLLNSPLLEADKILKDIEERSIEIKRAEHTISVQIEKAKQDAIEAALAEKARKQADADAMYKLVHDSKDFKKIPGAKVFLEPELNKFRGLVVDGDRQHAVKIYRGLEAAANNLNLSSTQEAQNGLDAIERFKEAHDLEDGGAIAQAAKQEYCEEIAAIIREAATVEVDGKAPVQTVSAQGISNGLDNIATNSDKAGATKAQLYMSTEAAARNLTEYHKALVGKGEMVESKVVASQLVALQDFRESTGTQVGGDTHNAYVTRVEQKALEVQKGALLDEKAPPLLARDVNARVEQMNQQERALEERLAQLERDKERQRRINELTTLPEMHPYLVAQLKSQIITPLPSDMPATKPDKFADPDFSSTKIKVAQDALLIRQGARDGAAKNIEDRISNNALKAYYDDSYQAAAENRAEDIPKFPFDHYNQAKAQDTSGTEIAATLMQQIAATRAALR